MKHNLQPRHPYQPKKVLVLGGTSSIAEATCRIWAKQGATLYLVSRRADRLEAVAQDLKVRGAQQAEWLSADLSNTECHDEVIADCIRKVGVPDTVLVAYGLLGDQKACQESYSAALEVYQVNLLSAVSLLTKLANLFSQMRAGRLVVLSSVAGDRGKQSNYVYGSAKAGLTVFLQGLRNRMHREGVRVITIKPGPVRTPMTRHLPNQDRFAAPETVAREIVRAVAKNRDEAYVPGVWQFWMFLVRSIPEGIFKRLSL